MKKQVLVTVDRGETRVAILEAEGDPAAAQGDEPGRAAAASAVTAAAGLTRVAELYIERRGTARSSATSTRARSTTSCPGSRPRSSTSASTRTASCTSTTSSCPGVEDGAPRARRAAKGKRIAELLKPGQEIVVQVVKDPLKTKGARLSMQLSIAGRYLVYVPQGEGVGVSRRLDDKERDRLRKEAKQLDLGGGGAIIRTAAQGAKREDFEREIKYLFKLHEVLQKRAEETTAPAMVFQEADLSVRVVRDIFSEQFEKAIVDDPKQHQRLDLVLHAHRAGAVDRVELYEERRAAVRALRRRQGDPVGCSRRRVDLPSGGYLIIDYAEAMTVIDVNSGSFTGRGKWRRLEDTITKTNLEAAEEVVRQLRLRDIGGIIVIDFIDMARARNRDAVLKTLRKSLDEDRTKTYVVEISPLGLVEMTRQNVTDGVREIMTKPCPTCDGEGVVLSEETVAIEVERELRELGGRATRRPRRSSCSCNPRVTHWFTHDGARNAARARGGDRQALPLRGLRGSADRPLRGHPGGRRATRSRSARCRSRPARRCSSTSTSRTCTTRTTRSPRSTAT